MSTVGIRNPVRCFCSFVAKRTDNNLFVCGRYKSSKTVCLFHLHHENLENYYQSNIFPMSLNCEMCLATIKIHSKEYIAPCRMTSIRCHCDDVATFYQSKKENLNNNTYFFGCANWKTPRNCNYFYWAHEYQTKRDAQILRRLISENETDSEQPRKPVLDEQNDDINKRYEELRRKIDCVICLSGERSHLIIPCNHLCCCSTCAGQIRDACPICRQPINSIQRIFFV